MGIRQHAVEMGSHKERAEDTGTSHLGLIRWQEYVSLNVELGLAGERGRPFLPLHIGVASSRPIIRAGGDIIGKVALSMLS
jgi:hypothetical protein